jgi:hypothetical protein
MEKKLQYTNAREVALLRTERRRRERPRDAVYNDSPAVLIDTSAKVPVETCRQADRLFEDRVRNAAKLGQYKLSEKREYFRFLMHAAKRAQYHDGCVMVPRNINHPDCTKARLQVVDSAVETGVFLEHRSPPGSPKQSRLVPLAPVERHARAAPWEFDPERLKQFVYLRERDTGRDLDVDWSIHIASETQERLELVNIVNSFSEITYEAYSAWEREFTERRPLWPIHYAVFTERWDWHGRLYTGRYGHQSLRQIERRTIQFDGEPCAELDYSSMHCRMLYHLHNLPCDGDPYGLWGESTTACHRLLAKTVVNAAINTDGEDDKDRRRRAVAACNLQLSTKTKAGQRKQGKELEDARRLNEAVARTGLKFAKVYDLAREVHHPIAHTFGRNRGMSLMRLDSDIALDILLHFAALGLPCLSCHDGFVVPRSARTELYRAMLDYYRLRLGFEPTVK